MQTTKRAVYQYSNTYHRDGTVTYWDVYRQQWCRGRHLRDEVYASFGWRERERTMRHVAKARPWLAAQDEDARAAALTREAEYRLIDPAMTDKEVYDV